MRLHTVAIYATLLILLAAAIVLSGCAEPAAGSAVPADEPASTTTPRAEERDDAGHYDLRIHRSNRGE